MEEVEWVDSKRCEACGGLNDDDATWCAQCYAIFEIPKPPPRVLEAIAQRSDPLSVASRLSETLGDSYGGASGLFGVWNGRASWKCIRCSSFNPVEQNECGCGGTFAQAAEAAADLSTAGLAQESGRATMRAFGWTARLLLIAGGLLAPITLVWVAIYTAVRRLSRWMFGAPR